MSDLISKLEEARDLLLERVTENRSPDATRYADLRRELLPHPSIKDRLPNCLKECRSLDDAWGYITRNTGTGSGTWTLRKQFLADDFNPLLDALEAEERAAAEPCDDEIAAALAVFDTQHVTRAWDRAQQRRSTDPAAAITSARSLLETACKHVLDHFGEIYRSDASVAALYSACARKLHLHPQDEQEQKMKQFLDACAKMANAIGELRNAVGDAHGPGAHARIPDDELGTAVVNLAGSLAAFLAARFDKYRRLPGEENPR